MNLNPFKRVLIGIGVIAILAMTGLAIAAEAPAPSAASVVQPASDNVQQQASVHVLAAVAHEQYRARAEQARLRSGEGRFKRPPGEPSGAKSDAAVAFDPTGPGLRAPEHLSGDGRPRIDR